MAGWIADGQSTHSKIDRIAPMEVNSELLNRTQSRELSLADLMFLSKIEGRGH